MIDGPAVITALRQTDDRSGGRREAWTDVWAAERALLDERAREAAGAATLIVERDAFANTWYVLPGERPGTVLVSSHSDCVPGGGWLDGAPEGAWAQVQRGELPKRLVEVAASARWVGSVCTGALLLAASGLLDGRYATTNRNAVGELEPYVKAVVTERVVDDGDRVTAGGLTAGIDLGLWITERELGTAKADEVAATIEYERQGRVWRAPRRKA
jgi:hypothetical protein